MMRREASVTPEGNVPFPDDRIRKDCPLLASHLADEYWDDGKPRDPSTLTIKVQDGRINLALNDREEKASLYVMGDTIAEATKALEKQLGLSNADWRAWTGQKKKK